MIHLGQYVINLDDGRKTVFRWLDHGDTGQSALSAGGYYGPGRGAANSLSALIEARRLSGDDRFRDKASQLIRRVVHPHDAIENRRLDVPEQRWFYTMFLQSLGRFLHDEVERAELDDLYAYSRASLVHYARWMVEHEHPYLEKPEKLEFKTETWAAQDIRKSDVFVAAALHAEGPERVRLLERARFFHEYSTSTLSKMPTRALARPVVVLLTSGAWLAWFDRQPRAAEPAPPVQPDFGQPTAFEPQRGRAVRRLVWLSAIGVCALAVIGLAIFLAR